MSTIEKIDELRGVPEIGKLYWVPAFEEKTSFGTLNIFPVYNHPHNDVENGQPETHYHIDYRFVKMHHRWHTINKHSYHHYPNGFRRYVPRGGQQLTYLALPLIRLEEWCPTPESLIAKSKLKRHCIHKGKCPHRGYDLSQVAPRDGVIRCPLHNLAFDAVTKQLLNNPSHPFIEGSDDPNIQ